MPLSEETVKGGNSRRRHVGDYFLSFLFIAERRAVGNGHKDCVFGEVETGEEWPRSEEMALRMVTLACSLLPPPRFHRNCTCPLRAHTFSEEWGGGEHMSVIPHNGSQGGFGVWEREILQSSRGGAFGATNALPFGFPEKHN